MAQKRPNGRTVAQLRSYLLSRDGDACGLCGHPLGDSTPDIDHIHPMADGGTNDPANLRLTHARCNRSKGGAEGGRRSKRGPAKPKPNPTPSPSPTPTGSTPTPKLKPKGKPSSDTRRQSPQARRQERDPNNLVPDPVKATEGAGGGSVVVERDRVTFDDVGGFVLPRVESARGGDGALGLAALEWIDANAPGALWPWQRYVVSRVLETEGGRLRWRAVLLCVSRQQGKSHMMQRLLWWRVNAGPLFGQPQSIINTAATAYQLAEDLMVPWAKTLGVGKLHRRDNIAAWQFDDGSFWRSAAHTKTAVTGRSVTCAFVDEIQSAKVDVVRRALVPTMSGPDIQQPQLLMAGTGEVIESDVLRQYRKAGVNGDGRVLLLEWSAPPMADHRDEESWKWASPAWSPERAEFLRTEAASMDVDKFRSEYLCQAHADESVAWVPWQAWQDARQAVPIPPSGVFAAVEDNVGRGAAVGLAWIRPDGGTHIEGRAFDRLTQAWAYVDSLRTTHPDTQLVVGLTLRNDPVVDGFGLPVTGYGQRETSAALPRLRELLADGRLSHDGPELTAQAANLAVRPNPAGGLSVAFRADHPTHVVRSAAWAALAASRQVDAPPAIW